MDELATATNEACSLLLLENSYDHWVVDIFEENGYQIPARRYGVKSNTDQVKSNVPTRYTSGGHFYEQQSVEDDQTGSNPTGSKRRKGNKGDAVSGQAEPKKRLAYSRSAAKRGWSKEGVARFNELCALVHESRKKDKDNTFVVALRRVDMTGTRKNISWYGSEFLHDICGKLGRFWHLYLASVNKTRATVIATKNSTQHT